MRASTHHRHWVMELAHALVHPARRQPWITASVPLYANHLQTWRKWPATGAAGKTCKGSLHPCRSSLVADGIAGHAMRSVGALLPVGVTMFLSHQQGLGLEGPMAVAIGRSCLQLTALGFGLKVIFEGDRVIMSLVAFTFMVCVAGYTAGNKAKKVPYSRAIALISLVLGAGCCMSLMLLLRLSEKQPQHFIPTAGYLIGNSMNMVGSALDRLYQNLSVHRDSTEASLALGATPEQAVRALRGRGTRQALAPMVDSLKTTGVVSLPGSMAGMLLAGCAPLDALALQMNVSYMLLGAASVSCLIATVLASRSLFTKAYQLSL